MSSSAIIISLLISSVNPNVSGLTGCEAEWELPPSGLIFESLFSDCCVSNHIKDELVYSFVDFPVSVLINSRNYQIVRVVLDWNRLYARLAPRTDSSKIQGKWNAVVCRVPGIMRRPDFYFAQVAFSQDLVTLFFPFSVSYVLLPDLTNPRGSIFSLPLPLKASNNSFVGGFYGFIVLEMSKERVVLTSRDPAGCFLVWVLTKGQLK